MQIGQVIQEIEYVVAPAVMCSSAALLLLGFQTKFSNLANRFRALSQERRELSKKPDRDQSETDRFNSLSRQVTQLLIRATHVKNAILLTYGAIILFLLTSVLIFFSVRGGFDLWPWVAAVFLSGLLLELIAAAVMMIEVALAFQIVRLESSH